MLIYSAGTITGLTALLLLPVFYCALKRGHGLSVVQSHGSLEFHAGRYRH